MNAVKAMQSYKIAHHVNAGFLVTEPDVDSQEAAPVGAPTLMSKLLFGLLGGSKLTIAVPKSKKVFVPYDTETGLVVQEVEFLGPNYLKFCNITGIVLGDGFEGTANPTTHFAGVQVYSRRPIKGLKVGERRHAVTKFIGDGKQACAIIEELLPLGSKT